MGLRIRIDHHTAYLYEKPVSFSPHFVRLFPRTEPGRLVQKLNFSTNEEAQVQFRRDLFDNNFARCFYPEKAAELRFHFVFEIELEEYNAFAFLLENHAAQFPFSYQPDDHARLAPYLLSTPNLSDGVKLIPLSFWNPPAEPMSTVSMLVELVEAIHKNIAYERREDGPARPPAETLKLGRGACRDNAVLMAALLREMGLAARLASGYLCELDAEDKDRRAQGAMHLWTEVYLPGAGWTGLDPTNGIFCNHNFITTAVGLTTPEVTPISGRYYGQEFVPSTMTASLELSAC
jgi:transglutaminase-like putative cysteine protease